MLFKKSEDIEAFGCNLIEKIGIYRDKLVTTIFYINCKNTSIVQISVFYKRGDFYWIGDDDNQSKQSQAKYFGDIPRAMNK